MIFSRVVNIHAAIITNGLADECCKHSWEIIPFKGWDSLCFWRFALHNSNLNLECAALVEINRRKSSSFTSLGQNAPPESSKERPAQKVPFPNQKSQKNSSSSSNPSFRGDAMLIFNFPRGPSMVWVDQQGFMDFGSQPSIFGAKKKQNLNWSSSGWCLDRVRRNQVERKCFVEELKNDVYTWKIFEVTVAT